MRRALDLARRVPLLRTAPNPRVGCILVKNGRVIAQASHEKFGGPHAEALALAIAGRNGIGATAYLTLEPCCHTDKKTPPCTQALIRAGIKRAVIACTDENPHVNGRGIRMLRNAGIDVAIGVLEKEARELNRFFFHWIHARRPFVTLKMAASLDGKITSSRRWLSNAPALSFVQRLRAEHDAILVGKNTVENDDPRLTVRVKGRTAREQPLRVVLIGTDFEVRVWEKLLTIPMGQLTTYSDLAAKAGAPKAARAVGAAVGKNPICFVVPCHRVIGKSGDLTGYHWGLTRKRAMLGWEAGKVAV